MSYLLGIDIGTSGTKTCLFRYDGSLVASALEEYPLSQPKPGWAEQDPNQWWQAVCESIGSILASSRITAAEIKGIGLSGQMHGLVLLDANGKVLRPSIIWCDQRTEAQAKWMEETIGREKIIKETANPPLPNFTATKLQWVREHEPEVYAQVHKVLLPKDYIRYRLTGEFATEVSDASGTLFLDVAKRAWSDEILKALEVNPSWLPKVYESYEISGTVSETAAAQTGLFKGTSVAGGAGDQAAGAVGNGIVENGIISATIGTSGVVFAYSEEVKIDLEGRLHSFCHAVPNKWHVMGVTQAAGGSLQWFRNQFGQLERAMAQALNKDPYELFSAQAEQIAPGSEGLIFLPYLMGERTPHLDSAAKGNFFGVTARHEKAHFIRSIMEGVSYSLADCLRLIDELGIEVNQVRASGGGAKSPVWRQIMADTMNQNVYTIEANEGPAFGVALLAGVGIGVYNSVDEACQQTVRLAQNSQPIDQNVAIYNDYYQVYQRLYKHLKDEFRVVHDLVMKQN